VLDAGSIRVSCPKLEGATQSWAKFYMRETIFKMPMWLLKKPKNWRQTQKQLDGHVAQAAYRAGEFDAASHRHTVNSTAAITTTTLGRNYNEGNAHFRE
jgi:hypothetical protein